MDYCPYLMPKAWMTLSLHYPPMTFTYPAHGEQYTCICTYCKDMSTDTERLRCHQTPEHCRSSMACVKHYVLDEGGLLMALAAWNNIFTIDDDQEPIVEQWPYRQTDSCSCSSIAAWVNSVLHSSNSKLLSLENSQCISWPKGSIHWLQGVLPYVNEFLIACSIFFYYCYICYLCAISTEVEFDGSLFIYLHIKTNIYFTAL